MPYNLLLLPLVGGYFILLNFVYFKYNYQRLSSQRILFNSIIAGILLLTFTFIVRISFEYLDPQKFNQLLNLLNESPIEHTSYLWTSVASFIIAVCATYFLNIVIYLINGCSYYKPIGYAVKRHGDEIEKLFRISAKTGELMKLTLKNNKVYIGYTDRIPIPNESNYLKITPVISGYRESITKKLVLTTEYFDVIDKYIDPSGTKEGSEDIFKKYDIDISIKQDEILTAGIFDEDVYNLFKAQGKVGEEE